MTERSILAAVSGIDANQTYLDSIANNIANSDTVGYKDSEVQFEDLLSEQLSGASAPSAAGNEGGINPVSVGSGVRVGGDDVDLSEGTLEETGQDTDVAIQGSGYLVVDSGGQTVYTRDGDLVLDGNGNLTTQDGGLVQGWQANGSGVINTNTSLGGVTIPTGETIPATATTSLTLGGNLPAWNGTGTAPSVTMTQDAYDSLGNEVPVTLTFTGVAGTANAWTVQGTVAAPGGGTDTLWTTAPTITFDPSTGQIATVNNGSNIAPGSDGSTSLPVGTMPAGFTFPSGDTWNIKFPPANSSNAVTQFSGQQTLQIASQDGHASGSLETFSIGADGIITGSFSDGTTLSLGQIAIADFTNPAGLSETGSGEYTITPNSGEAEVGIAGTGGRGTLVGGELEQSNVDLGTELTNLIGAQEAYDANTKVLTATQDSIQSLETAV